MTRFLKVFLRDPLQGQVHLAGFGKHPAWDDHIDDIGLETESLVIAKQVIYSEGIASQISSGAWNQLENSRHAIDFDHRFVWGRSNQSLVGGIWASIDGKGRTLFPMVICVQSDGKALVVVGRFLSAIERLRKIWKQAKTKESVHLSRNRAASEISSSYPTSPNEIFSEVSDPDANVMLPALLTLSAGLKPRTMNDLTPGGSHLRLPGICARATENLGFWAGYLDKHRDLNLPYLAIAPAGKRYVDLIVGEPQPRDFFCLRADNTALPETGTRTDPSIAERFEASAQGYLRTFRSGAITPDKPRRSWWSGLFKRFAQ
jgi:hypothetical protein